MRCHLQVSSQCHPYLMAYHYAAHAVAMHRFRVPVFSVRLDARRHRGAVHALLPIRDGAGSRIQVERDAICALVGNEAEKFGCDSENWIRTWQDAATVSKRLRRFTYDRGERSAWHIYLQQRARQLVERAWHEITVVAAVLQREGAMDAASLGATIEAFRENPFRADLRPLPPVPWKRPTYPKGKDEVELIWCRPTLSEVVGRVRR